MLAHHTTPCNIKTTPQALYTLLLNIGDTVPQHSSSHIHMHLTDITIQNLRPNAILGTAPAKMQNSEHELPRPEPVHLSRLCCGHYTALVTCRKRIDDSIDETCTHCNTSIHSLTHIMTHCPALTHIRAQHNIGSSLDLWHSPANCLLFPQLSGFARPDKLWINNNNNNNNNYNSFAVFIDCCYN